MRLTALPLLLAATLLASAPAWAGIREDVVDGASRCNRIADDRQWLDCFYGAAQPMRARLGLTPAPESQQILSRAPGMATVPVPARPVQGAAPAPALAAAAPPPPREFGMPARDSSSNRETGRIAAFSFDQFGIFTATLTNGQVWQQTSSDSTKAHWHSPPSQTAYNVVISEGFLGGYDFKVVGMSGIYKVKRIK